MKRARPTLDARRALIANARAFFELHLRGCFRWDEVVISKPEKAAELPNGRRNPLGPHREMVEIRFGRFTLMLNSPEDDPPLGWIVCTDESGDVTEGPPDAAIWSNVGRFIRERMPYVESRQRVG